MFRSRLLNVVLSGLIFLLPPALVAGRLAHPGPWLAFAIACLMLLTQPPLGAKEVMIADREDRLPTVGIYVAQFASGIVAVLQFTLRRDMFPPAVSAWTIAAVLVAMVGLGVRLWAIRTLGKFFTSTVQIANDQTVVQSGPYRLLRHPSYTGAILAPVAAALGFGSTWGVAIIILGVVPSYLARIRVEEEALLRGLGEPYREYRLRTWRLIPFVY